MSLDVPQVCSSRLAASCVSAPVALRRGWLWQLPPVSAWLSQPRCLLCWPHGAAADLLAVLPPLEPVVQQRGVRLRLGKGKQSPCTAMRYHSWRPPRL